MARPREELQSILESLLGSDEVYFQAPDGRLMQYPAIKYNRGASSRQHASNLPYRDAKGYTLIFMSRKPDDPLADQIEDLPYTTLERTYRIDGLNHSVFTTFF